MPPSFQFVAFFSLGMVVLSTLTFVISTMEEFQGRVRSILDELFLPLFPSETNPFSTHVSKFLRNCFSLVVCFCSAGQPNL